MNESLFGNLLQTIPMILDLKFKSLRYKHQNSADIGELCEIFIRDLLNEFLSDRYRIVRGRKIINSNGDLSSQIDILLIAKNSLEIFDEKGIYPIEAVYGIFSITSNLSTRKAKSAIKEFESIPNKDSRAIAQNLITSNSGTSILLTPFMQKTPLKVIFSFEGKSLKTLEKELSNSLKNGEKSQFLPDFIWINKKQLLIKVDSDNVTKLISGEIVPKGFHLIDLSNDSSFHLPLYYILHLLFHYSQWQNYFYLNYAYYFDKEIESLIKLNEDEK